MIKRCMSDRDRYGYFYTGKPGAFVGRCIPGFLSIVLVFISFSSCCWSNSRFLYVIVCRLIFRWSFQTAGRWWQVIGTFALKYLLRFKSRRPC